MACSNCFEKFGEYIEGHNSRTCPYKVQCTDCAAKGLDIRQSYLHTAENCPYDGWIVPEPYPNPYPDLFKRNEETVRHDTLRGLEDLISSEESYEKTISPNEIKKGWTLQMKDRSFAIMADNKRGRTRYMQYEGEHGTSHSSEYVSEIAFAKDPVSLIWYIVKS